MPDFCPPLGNDACGIGAGAIAGEDAEARVKSAGRSSGRAAPRHAAMIRGGACHPRNLLPARTELVSRGRLNSRLGVGPLTWPFPRFDGDVECVLIAYNAGPGRLKRWLGEAGSYAAWRAARDAAGNSQVLAYARDVQDYRQRLAERGLIAQSARAGSETPAVSDRPVGADGQPAPSTVGPPASNSQR